MTPPVIGVILIIFGIIYTIKPEIFKKLISWKIVFSPQRYSPKQFKNIMRLIGVVLIVIGIYLTLLKY